MHQQARQLFFFLAPLKVKYFQNFIHFRIMTYKTEAIEILRLWNFRCVSVVCCGMCYFLTFPRRTWHFQWQTSCSAWLMGLFQGLLVFIAQITSQICKSSYTTSIALLNICSKCFLDRQLLSAWIKILLTYYFQIWLSLSLRKKFQLFNNEISIYWIVSIFLKKNIFGHVH